MASDDYLEIENSDEQDGTEEQTRPQPYLHEPLYKELLEKYQNADWVGCAEKIDLLLELYPGDQSLLEFQREVNVRQLLQTGNQNQEREEKRAKNRSLLVRVVIAIAILAGVFFAVRLGVNTYQNNLEQARLERERANQAKLLSGYYENAENNMQAKRWDAALEEYQKIFEIDPEYENVVERLQEAEAMKALDTRYLEGVELYDSGEIMDALEIFEEVQAVVPNYRNTTSLIEQINNVLEIDRLLEEAQQAYADQNWQLVVDDYEAIVALDSSVDTSSIDEALYMSYINLIFDTADRPDATREDVEKAESYYRNALAIFPQNRELVAERQELERVAKSLLSNKYYLYALELLDVDDYSVNSLQEALRLLNKAKNFGSTSPAIESEINRTTLYLDAFDDFVNKRWEDAIDNLEQLYRTDPDYANGVIKFLLYEAYTARGDTLFTFGDYVNASKDYDEAAKFAYGDSGTTIQLYQIEIRLGYALRRLTSIQEAAAYFDHALGIVNFADKAADNASLLDTFDQARSAYNNADFWNAVRLYEITLEDTNVIYEFETVSANTGDSIAHLAFYYGSTAEAIREFNELGDSMVVRTDTELVVPVLAEDRN